MGRLSNLFEKIKGMFNRNKALPEGTTEKNISVGIPEAPEITPHESFVDNLRIQAETFDLTQMPIEDAILKALEEKGLNPELSKNPEFKNQMYKVFSSVFQTEYGESRSPEKFEELRNTISFGHLNDISFTIIPDGNFKFDKANEGKNSTNPPEHKFFTVDNKGSLHVVQTYSTELRTDYDKDGKFSPQTSVDNYKVQTTYDKTGLQTDYMKAHESWSRKPNEFPGEYISGDSFRLSRNSDLATAKLTCCDKCELTPGEIQSATSLFPEYPNNRVSTRAIDVWTIGEHPKELDRIGAMGINYSTIEQINKEVQQHEYELNSGAISKDGTGFYENLSSKYHCLPRAITADEQAYRKSTIKSYLDFCAKQSPFIKKIAEQKGLIEPEQAIEQE